MQFRNRIKESSASAMLPASPPAHPKRSSVSQCDDSQSTAEYLWLHVLVGKPAACKKCVFCIGLKAMQGSTPTERPHCALVSWFAIYTSRRMCMKISQAAQQERKWCYFLPMQKLSAGQEHAEDSDGKDEMVNIGQYAHIHTKLNPEL